MDSEKMTRSAIESKEKTRSEDTTVNNATPLPNVPKSASKLSFMRRFLHCLFRCCTLFFVSLLAVVLFAVATTVFLIATPSGRSFAVAAADRWVPGLSISGISGDWHDLAVTDIHYETTDFALHAGKVGLCFDWETLFKSKLRDVHVTSLRLTDIQTKVASTEEGNTPNEATSTAPIELTLPVALRIDTLELNRLGVTLPDTAIQLESLNAGISLLNGQLALKGLTLSQLAVNHPSVQLNAARIATTVSLNDKLFDVTEFSLDTGAVTLSTLSTLENASPSATTPLPTEIDNDASAVVEPAGDAPVVVPQAPSSIASKAESLSAPLPEQKAIPTRVPGSSQVSSSTLIKNPLQGAQIEVPQEVPADVWLRQVEAFFEKPLISAEALPSAPLSTALSALGRDIYVRSFTIDNWRIEGLGDLASVKDLPGFEPFEIHHFAAATKLICATTPATKGISSAVALDESAQNTKPADRIALELLELDTSVAKLSAKGEISFARTSDVAWPIDLEAKVEADARPWLAVANLVAADEMLAAKAAHSTLALHLTGAVAGKIHFDAHLSGLSDITVVLDADPTQVDPPVKLSITSPEIVAPSVVPVTTPVPAAAQNSRETVTPEQTALPNQKKEQAAKPTVTQGSSEEDSKPDRYVLHDLTLSLQGTPRKWAFALSGRPELSGGMTDELLASIKEINSTPTSSAAKRRATAAKGRKGVIPAEPLQAILPGNPVTGVFEASALGTLGNIDVTTLALDLPFGHIEGALGADWRNHLAWKGDVKLRGVDMGRWVRKLPLKLEADVAGEGILRTDGILILKKAQFDTDGTIAYAPLGLHLAFTGENALSWKLERLDVLLGRNTLKASGSLENLRDLKLNLDIDAPGLLNTIPGLTGKANGRVRMEGSIAHPKIFADVTASGLAFEDSFALKRLRLDMDVRNAPALAPLERSATAKAPLASPFGAAIPANTLPGKVPPPLHMPAPPAENAPWEEKLDFILSSLSEGAFEGRINFSAEGLSAGDTAIGAVALKVTGNERTHHVDFSASGDLVTGHLALEGAFNRDTLDWKGALLSAAFATPAGEWKSLKPVALEWSTERNRFEMAPHCWNHVGGKACLEKPLVITESGQVGEAHLVLERLNMAILRPWLRKKSDRIEGTLKGRLDLQWALAKQKLPSVSLDLNGDGLSYSTRWEGVRFPVTLTKLRAHAMVTSGRVALAWNIQPEGDGTIAGAVGIADPLGARRLEGGILIDHVTPSLIRPFLSRGEKAEGALNARLHPTGTLAEPRLEGYLSVDDVVVAADFVPFEMEPSEVRLNFLGNQTVLTGNVRSKTGTVMLSGNASWRKLTDWAASVQVKTEGFHADVRSLAQVDVKGHVEAEATPSKVRLSGDITIPKSLIEVKELPASAIQVSEDQVLLDTDLVPLSTRAESLPVEGDIKVALGDDVRVAAFGLRAKLDGGVRFVAGKGKSGLLGQINIAEGRFRAYGQDLVVQSGRILFSGPMTNPGLRIEAIRNPENTADDVTAGIRVTGTADAPKVTLFSTPQLSEQETLSYLLRGEGLGSEEGSSSAMMTSMLIGIGTSQGSGILSEVGDVVGLRGLGVDTTGTGDEQKVVVSAYVLPGLQVKYGVGIFDSIATITLRYRLLPKLYLEAASGAEQALDLLYRFEW